MKCQKPTYKNELFYPEKGEKEDVWQRNHIQTHFCIINDELQKNVSNTEKPAHELTLCKLNEEKGKGKRIVLPCRIVVCSLLSFFFLSFAMQSVKKVRETKTEREREAMGTEQPCHIHNGYILIYFDLIW